MDINNELAIYAKYNLSSSNWLLLRLLILANLSLNQLTQIILTATPPNIWLQ